MGTVSDMNAPAAAAHPAPELASLAPEFSPERHGVYVEILERAINTQPSVRNIALAGAYGTGKSSVLSKVADTYGDRVVEISLLTLGKKPEAVASGADSNPAAGSPTNRIQNEIVKQLLYRRSPSQAPESRFHRIVRFRAGREIPLAILAGVLTLAVLIAAGLDMSPLERVGISLPTAPTWVRSVTSYVAIVAAVTLVVLVTRLMLRGRLGVEKITAGPATITLPARSSSYFDEYLDEIIYFFETNPKPDILIIEDLDRFDDPHIFESLRSLNLILNSAHQLDGRNIRFVYAVKDSIFENLGYDEKTPAGGESQAELVRANRTKFFELVVPMVPFITHKNARDLMHSQLKQHGQDLPKDLINLAARHVADMRLIHNIVNEYKVFKHTLLDGPSKVPGLDPERLFAMVLYKNAHAGDFEAIRLGSSALDRLFGTWRSLVSANLHRIRTDETRLNARIERQEAADEYASELGSKLRALIRTLATAPGTGIPNDQIVAEGSPVNEEELESAQFWRNIVKDRRSVSITAQHYRTQGEMTLSADSLEVLLGVELSPDEWVEISVGDDRTTIAQNQTDANFLRRHSWKALADRPEFIYAVGDKQGPDDKEPEEEVLPRSEPARNFREWTEHILPSQLAVDLVVNGWITSYFSLHVSAFYGQLIRPDAMTYVLRNVDHGTADPDYPLDAADVEAILRDQGASVLHERSMYNVSILDHLLTTAPAEAAVVVSQLATGGSDELAFMDIYLAAGGSKHQLVAELSSELPTIFTYLVGRAPGERRERAKLVDVAVANRSDETVYELTSELRSFIESNFLGMPSLTDGESHAAARTVEFIAELGAVLPDVAGLSDVARDALARTRAYRLTGPNLERLTTSDDISLDQLRLAPGDTYSYAVSSLSEYMQAHEESGKTNHTIGSPDMFVEILNASESWTDPEYEWLVRGAHLDCRVTNLEEVPEPSWPTIVESHRTAATFENVATYVERRDGGRPSPCGTPGSG